MNFAKSGKSIAACCPGGGLVTARETREEIAESLSHCYIEESAHGWNPLAGYSDSIVHCTGGCHLHDWQFRQSRPRLYNGLDRSADSRLY